MMEEHQEMRKYMEHNKKKDKLAICPDFHIVSAINHVT